MSTRLSARGGHTSSKTPVFEMEFGETMFPALICAWFRGAKFQGWFSFQSKDNVFAVLKISISNQSWKQVGLTQNRRRTNLDTQFLNVGHMSRLNFFLVWLIRPHFETYVFFYPNICGLPFNDRRQLTTDYRWTSWFCKIIGWSSRLQENYPPI